MKNLRQSPRQVYALDSCKSLKLRLQTTRDCEHVETQMSLPLPMIGSWHRTIGLYTVFETVETPAGIACLCTALAKMD